jgi:hypothetical protein
MTTKYIVCTHYKIFAGYLSGDLCVTSYIGEAKYFSSRNEAIKTIEDLKWTDKNEWVFIPTLVVKN